MKHNDANSLKLYGYKKESRNKHRFLPCRIRYLSGDTLSSVASQKWTYCYAKANIVCEFLTEEPQYFIRDKISLIPDKSAGLLTLSMKSMDIPAANEITRCLSSI